MASDDDTAPDIAHDAEADAHPARSWTVTWVVGILALAVGLAGGLVTGARVLSPGDAADSGAATASPAESSVDVGFARDMKKHHAQAVKLSTLLRERTDDAKIRTIALDIALTQQQQIGQMYAWLDLWGYSQSAGGETMRWMSAHGNGDGGNGDGGNGDAAANNGNAEHHSGRMPGMATQEQLDALAASRGREAEVRFLRLMIEHHRGGIAMAQEAAEQATVLDVRRLARKMVAAQRAEIDAMRAMLQDRRA